MAGPDAGPDDVRGTYPDALLGAGFQEIEYRVEMTNSAGQPLDDLAIDYSTSQVTEGISILETRGELPKWAVPHIVAVVGVLQAQGSYPPHVGQSADRACRQNGYVLSLIVSGLEGLATTGASGANCPLRTLRGFLTEWRRLMRASRPAPKFTPRQH